MESPAAWRCSLRSAALVAVTEFLKRHKGTERVRQGPRPFCLRFRGGVTPQVVCKNNSLLQSAKEMAQCTRINAVALAFLISTEGGRASL